MPAARFASRRVRAGELAALGLPDLGNLPARPRRAYLGLPKVVFTAAGTRLKMQCSGEPAGALGWEDASVVPGVSAGVCLQPQTLTPQPGAEGVSVRVQPFRQFPGVRPAPLGRGASWRRSVWTLYFWLSRLAWNLEEILCKTPQGELKLPPHQLVGGLINPKIGRQCQVGHHCRPWALGRHLGIREVAAGNGHVGREQWSSPILALVPPYSVEPRVLRGRTHPNTGTAAVVLSRRSYKLVLAI